MHRRTVERDVPRRSTPVRQHDLAAGGQPPPGGPQGGDQCRTVQEVPDLGKDDGIETLVRKVRRYCTPDPLHSIGFLTCNLEGTRAGIEGHNDVGTADQLLRQLPGRASDLQHALISLPAETGENQAQSTPLIDEIIEMPGVFTTGKHGIERLGDIIAGAGAEHVTGRPTREIRVGRQQHRSGQSTSGGGSSGGHQSIDRIGDVHQ